MSEEEEIFQLALSQPAEARQAFLHERCGSHASMMRRIEVLLDAHAEDDFMRTPATQDVPDIGRLLLGEKPGDRVGPYELLLQIGSGGFGAVWMALQTAPVRRTVALKILKLGMDTREVVSRFEQERETLALMNHPNIARIYDAGATPSGRPFIAMELVRGLSVTRWCDEHRVVTRERIRLFIQVCHAVQHAHQKGVIHRDLKPSNVLVTEESGSPSVKVIDFGVAKATQSLGLDFSFLTQLDQVIGTPIYMSPEQAGPTAQDADTRSDIYSLGVLLYELLTGSTPIESSTAASLGADEVRRLIREEDPGLPSHRLKAFDADQLETAAQRRGVTSALLPTLVHGDLDWIVMKCLEKDRERRYESADALALDLERHLKDEPVLATPRSRYYLISKAFVRHRALVSVAAGLVFLLLAAAVAASALALRSKQAQVAEGILRTEADASRLTAERNRNEALLHAYEADMGAAALLYRSHDFGQVATLLQSHDPAESKLPDFRGFEWFYLNDRIKGEQSATLRGHRNMVGTVAFSRSGKWIASGDLGGGVRVWDAASGQPVASWQQSDARIVGLSFSHDDQLLAVGDGFRVALYTVPDFTEKNEIEFVATRPVFSPTEPILALGVNDNRWYGTQGEVQVWRWKDDPDGSAMTLLRGAGTRLNFSADGKTLLTGVTGERLQVWSLGTGARTAAYPLQGALDIAIARDGSWAAATTPILAPSPRLWDLGTGRELPPLLDRMKSAVSLAASPTENVLAVGSSDQFITLWNVGRRTVIRTFEGHQGEVTALAFSPDGKSLVSGSMDETVRLWRTDAPARTDQIRGVRSVLGMGGVRVSPDGSRIAAPTAGRVLKIWRSDSLAPEITLGYGRWALAFSPDGARLVTLRADGTMELWDTRTGENLGGIVLPVAPHQDCISSLSPDGRIAAICSGQDVSFVQTLGGRVVFQSSDSRGLILGSAFSPDGSLHVTVSQDGRAIVREVPHGLERHVLTGHKQDVRALAVSPDGKWIATGGHDTRIKIWDTESGRELADLPGQRQVVNFLAFTADNRTLISAGDEDEIYFRRVGDWRIIGRHRVPAPVRSMSISADGSLLAVIGHPDVLAVYRAPNGRPAPSPSHPRWVLDRLPPVSWAVDGIPPRPPALPPACLDLGRFYTARLKDSWAAPQGAEECSLAAFPAGGCVLDGIAWDARGVLQVYHREREFAGGVMTVFPDSVTGIPVGQTARRLHLLAAATWAPVGAAPEAGRLRLHYATGEDHDAAILLGRDVFDWFGNTPAQIPPDFRSSVAWTGTNATSTRARTNVRLFHMTVENPHPDRTISSIDLAAVHGCPFVVAITVEP